MFMSCTPLRMRFANEVNPLQENNMLVLESPGPPLAIKTVSKTQVVDDPVAEQRLAAMVCSLDNKDECLMCGS